ncbi:MAG TPA: SusD/RagB family nutrient-binding outer membrane lipoprotein [Bacteroidales bacterium]|nr:SusD/RagB family nutrient-binding outer membrane lipoprotein [Bacteroidales bacterium]
MKTRIFLIISLFTFLVTCTDDFEEFNRDPKNPAEVPGNPLFTNGQLSLLDQISNTDVNLNVFKLYAQYWTQTTYTDEANYDLVTRTIPDNLFLEYYRDILRDLNEASKIITETEPIDTIEAAEKPNRLAIIDLHVVYAYQNLVDIFGDIPYNQALKIDSVSPTYDDASFIYQDLIRRVNDAIANLNPDAGSFGDADLIYGGDVASWIKFANTLKVKLGITLADYDPAVSRTTVESAVAGGIFESPADNAELQYLTSINVNPLYEDLVQSGRDDYVPANTIVDAMKARSDPRLPFYFTTLNGQYTGGRYGYSNPFSQRSHIADAIAEPDFPGRFLTYDELMFYLAEAAARGYSVGGAPQQFYDAGIRSSILWWGGTEDMAATYLTRPDVAWNSAGSGATFREKIGMQSWIALYTRGLEAWTQWRRLDYPVFNVPPLSLSDPPAPTDYNRIPKRFTYPINEQTLNARNYQMASQNIGGDEVTTRIFWDVADPQLPAK